MAEMSVVLSKTPRLKPDRASARSCTAASTVLPCITQPRMARNRVLLPAPLGPSSAVELPQGMSRVTSSSAGVRPWRTVTLRKRRMWWGAWAGSVKACTLARGVKISA